MFICGGTPSVVYPLTTISQRSGVEASELFQMKMPNRTQWGLIYFLPNDSQPRPNVEVQIDALIKEIQESLAYSMEAYGFGRKTFTFQADATGKAVVHHVNGKFNQAYYQDWADYYRKVWDEIDEQFSSQRTIYVFLGRESRQLGSWKR